ncbi:putative amidase family protein [Tothia fuscella]|uniref:Amidase family protein n=1 Tax=Tothia fuscella TaxID=1048955 RepID=A0A9P4NUL7_9PEZI|nr:putative amidase family protein [Tothia fuscella]
MLQIAELTIDKVHKSYRNGEYTSRQLCEAYLERIKLFDQAGSKLNAIVIVSQTALEEADALDNYLKEHGELIGPLHGVPIIAKDQCDTAGLQTTYGNKLCKHIPTKDATLVKKLKDAGGIILAKSTMPDFAASYNSASSVSGETRNPYDLTRESGGSSAGTGAAIAANFGLIGIGEDTGGSIRVPASFCNLVGLRPTVGLISRDGLSPLLKPHDTPGPMARTVRDAALMLDCMVGYDPADPYTATALLAGPPRGCSYESNLTTERISKARIGVLNCMFGDDQNPECSSVNKVVRAALAKLQTSGTILVDIPDIPNLEEKLNFSATFLSRSRYDIDSFLTKHPHIKQSVETIFQTRSFHPALSLFEKIGPGIKTPYEDPQYAQRLEARDNLERQFIGIMAEYKLDAIVYPTVRIPPPTIEDVLGPRFYASFPTNTSIGSRTNMPALSMPAGFTDDTNLPVGMEMLGLPYQEQPLLELGFGVESLLNARKPPVFEG